MPTYQYACTECGEPLEVVQSFTDDALTECPSCGGRLRKRYNAVGIVFKGSGFYRTDSRAGSSSSDTAKSAPSPNGKSGSGASDSSGSADSSAASGSSSGSGSKDSASKGSASKGSGTSAA